jgi:hypothetical protein
VKPVLAKTTPFLTSAAVVLTLFVPGSADAGVGSPRQYLKEPDAWFASDQAKRLAHNILSY